LHHPDAFPASDIGILRNAEQIFGEPLSPAQLVARSEPWRPWRGYAAQHLWTAGNANLTPRRKQTRTTASPAARMALPASTSIIAPTGDRPTGDLL
jgi:AraC family transcriptional regulator of adaptative response / DNA-3-methyladenine glycosylase II